MSGREQARIETVRRVRDLLARRALGRLAAGQRRVAEADEHLRQARDAYERRPGSRPSTAGELQGARMVGMGAHEALGAAASDVDVAAHRRDELAEEWSAASIEHKSAERLAERRALAAAAAAERVAQSALDELVAQRRGRR